MKTKLSFILFFAFLFCSSQEIVDKKKFKKCRKEFSKKICLSDEDKDSVLFYLDECPKIFGVAENNGCAWTDTDNDSIFDKDDACPDVSGPEENHGCPWPDTDGDGVLDKDDKCPTRPGSTKGDGCGGKSDKECKKQYEDEKKQYEEDLKKVEEVDFNKLFDGLLEEKEFKSQFSSKKIVLLNYRTNYSSAKCGNEPLDYCSHFEKEFYVEIIEKIWKNNNFNRLQKMIGNKIIIPVAKGGKYFEFEEQNDSVNFFTLRKISPFYNGRIIDEYGKQKKFYYYSELKPQKELIVKEKKGEINSKTVTFKLSVLYDNEEISKKENSYSYLIQLQLLDDTDNKALFNKTYRYKNEKWVAL